VKRRGWETCLFSAVRRQAMRQSESAEMISCALHKNLDLPNCALPLVPVMENVLYFMKNGSWMHPPRFRHLFMKFVPDDIHSRFLSPMYLIIGPWPQARHLISQPSLWKCFSRRPVGLLIGLRQLIVIKARRRQHPPSSYRCCI
jgi:hypothetical protein